MATSPDYLRLATSASRALADAALDSLRDSVVVVDARHTHLPVVLANASARRCLTAMSDGLELVESPLHLWLAATSLSAVEATLANLAETQTPVSCMLTWRFSEGDVSVMTDIKYLPGATGQRLFSITFAPVPESGLIMAVDDMPFDVLTLDGDLKVTYANASARSTYEGQAGLLSTSALWLTPTSALQLDVFARALQGCHFHTDALEVRSADGKRRWFEVDVQPLRSAAGIVGLVVLSLDVTSRKDLEQEVLTVSGRERQSIGRDLHDGLGQELTGVALMLRGLATRVRQHSVELGDSVVEIAGVVNRSIESTRSLSRGLLPVCADSGGLVIALQELASRSRDLYGLEVNLRTKVAPNLQFDEVGATHLYRIAQEALNNAARHGHAALVDILLVATSSTFSLSISDDGEGIGEPKSSYTGMGLNIMKYRAGMVGARFELASREPRGTVVRVIGERSLEAAKTLGPHHLKE
jgi:PAS domain S-box-containing protein